MIKTTLLFFLLLYSYSFSQNIHISDAVNISTKQRVLAQKMTKDKLFIEVNEKTSIAQKELENSITEFEKNLKTLKAFAPTKEIHHEVEEQEFAYKLYKELILDTTKKSMEEIVTYNSLFLAICDDVVKSIIKHSKTLRHDSENTRYIVEHIAQATSASSRIKLLSQRLTLYYGLKDFRIANIETEQINNISKKIESNLNYLTLLEFNSLDIDDSLGEVVFLWNQIKSKLRSSKKVSSNELFDLCNQILDKAENTTQLYVNLNK